MNNSTSTHQPRSGAPAGGHSRHSRTRFSDSFVSALGLPADASDAAIEAVLITQVSFGRFLLDLTGATTPQDAKALIEAALRDGVDTRAPSPSPPSPAVLHREPWPAPPLPLPASREEHRQVPPRALVSDEVLAFETGADLSVVRQAREQVQAAMRSPSARPVANDAALAADMGVDVATVRQAREQVQAALRVQGQA